MLVKFELQKSDLRRIKENILKDISDTVNMQIEGKEMDLVIARLVDTAVCKEFNILRREVQQLVKEEIKVQTDKKVKL